MNKANFLKRLDQDGIKYTEKDGVIIIDEKGSVYLSSLTALPDGIQFNNQGSVYLRSLKNFDETQAGADKRNLYVVNGDKYGMRISLGCFIGTEEEALSAVRRNIQAKPLRNTAIK